MAYDEIRVGDRIRFDPQEQRLWWTVRARSSRYLVAIRQVSFRPRGTLQYSVVDLTWSPRPADHRLPPGIARSSLNIVGGGWGDGTYSTQECEEILEAIESGEWELSTRRIRKVAGIEHRVEGDR